MIVNESFYLRIIKLIKDDNTHFPNFISDLTWMSKVFNCIANNYLFFTIKNDCYARV